MPKAVGTDDQPVLSNGQPDTAKERFLMRRAVQAGLLKAETAQAQLVERLLTRLDTVQEYLADDAVWFEKLEKAPLRDIAIMEGIWLDKLQAVQGKGTPVLGPPQQAQLDTLLPVLLQAMQQRGLTIGVSERTLEFKT
jgi:hypothetical protein